MDIRNPIQLLILPATLLLLTGCETVDRDLRRVFDGLFSNSSDEGSSPARRTRIDSTAASRKDLDALLEAGPEGVELTDEESALYELIMDYRRENGLPSIPLSPSLTFVAQVHARDTAKSDFPEGCNLHSWSDEGPWQGGCYTGDHANAQIM